MDLIDRDKAIKACFGMIRETGIDELPYEYAESELSRVDKVDAIPLSVIEEIKADIIEMRKRDPLYYYVSTEDILDWVLNTIDRKVKEYADGNNNRSRDAEI